MDIFIIFSLSNRYDRHEFAFFPGRCCTVQQLPMYTTTDGCSTILQAGKNKERKKRVLLIMWVCRGYPQKRKKIKIKKGQSMMMMMSPHVIKRASVPSVYKRKKEEDGRSRGYLSFGRPQYICVQLFSSIWATELKGKRRRLWRPYLLVDSWILVYTFAFRGGVGGSSLRRPCILTSQ